MTMIPETSERKIFDYPVGGRNPFFLIAGPCVIESDTLLFRIAEKLKELQDRFHILIFFKASFDKANRSSIKSFRGPGLEEGLRSLQRVKEEFSLPLVTDIHETSQVEAVAEVVDMGQIPAFLCRQTDLVVAAAQSFRYLNIKKGQFLAPGDIDKIVEKVVESGNRNFYITERGYTFGYNNLVVDPRSFEIMRSQDIPVIFDATHSVQMPGGGTVSGGNRAMIAVQARAAVAAGVEGLFFEVHPEPEKGLSDASNMYYLDKLESMIANLLAIDALVKGRK